MDEQRPFLMSRTVQFVPPHEKFLLLPGATRDLKTWTRDQGLSASACLGLTNTLNSLDSLPAVPDPVDHIREPFPRTQCTRKHGWETERYGELARTTTIDPHPHMAGLTQARFLTGVLPYVYDLCPTHSS